MTSRPGIGARPARRPHLHEADRALDQALADQGNCLRFAAHSPASARSPMAFKQKGREDRNVPIPKRAPERNSDQQAEDRSVQ